VRNLAQRSAAAAKEIKTLIGDSVDKVNAGSKLVRNALLPGNRGINFQRLLSLQFINGDIGTGPSKTCRCRHTRRCSSAPR
jgi:hypothetical protein